jgi:hypothetical protein
VQLHCVRVEELGFGAAKLRLTSVTDAVSFKGSNHKGPQRKSTMENLQASITSGLAERYGSLAARVRELAAPLTDEEFWRKPFPFGNSFGHLVLHLTGNLNYYVGAQIAGTGYVRDRDLEFTDTRCLPKEEVLQRFDAAIAIVLQTVRAQSEKDWSTFYSAVGAGDAGNRFHMVLKCAAHMDHHVGQMIYLCFELKRSRT